MQSRVLGKTGVAVSAIGFGVVPLSLEDRPSEAEAVRVIHEALDAGIDWLDTANAYGKDASEMGYGERLVARALREWGGNRTAVRVATKGGHVRPDGRWEVDGRPESLKKACEESLRALGTETIFLYQLHRPDPDVYFPDSVGALADLKRQGKIQHVGLSNVELSHIRSAQRIVEVATVQNRANIVDRAYFESGVVAGCEKLGVGFLAHSPFGGLMGHQRIGEHEVLGTIGMRRGLSPYQVALAWLLSLSPNILPIPGSRQVANVKAAVTAASVTLYPEDLAELDAFTPPASPLSTQRLRIRKELGFLARNVRAVARKWAGNALRRPPR